MTPTTKEAAMGGFADKAREFADQHDDQVDKGLDKAGDEANQRTGSSHGDQIDKGVDWAQQHTGDDDQSN
jgi:MT0933-like antitoxin protein